MLDSKGVLDTRKFLANLNNELGGAQLTAEDILFFNGLGDAIAKLYQYLVPTARIIGPSPAYSTHSSAEAAHANTAPITYRLDTGQSMASGYGRFVPQSEIQSLHCGYSNHQPRQSNGDGVSQRGFRKLCKACQGV